MTRTIERDDRFCESADGIFLPVTPVTHRDEQYHSAHFERLLDMQSRHYWYLGRHRFLARALRDTLRSTFGRDAALKAIDLGGGCGGWIQYLKEHAPQQFVELALGDSSLRALEMAQPVVGNHVGRYQVDLLNLPWRDRWDVVFLLDVLAHLPDDVEPLRQVAESLRPGGLLFVADAALKYFWTYNDEFIHHFRRYSRRDFRGLADRSGLELCYSRYFMFFLSPLLLLSRIRTMDLSNMSREDIRRHLARTHRVPMEPINQVLRFVFSLETPTGLWVPFPWGTSILGVFRKPR